MSMLKKFNEYKKAMHDKLDAAEEVFRNASDEAVSEFMENFRSLVVNAPEQEFCDFVFHNKDELDEMDAMAAVAMRLEARAERKAEGKTVNVVVVGID